MPATPRFPVLGMKNLPGFRPFLGLAIAALTLVSAWKVSAHGGGVLQLENVPAGPYLLSVWLDPPDVVAGRPFHVTVGLNQVSESVGRPVLDADILVELLPAGADQPSLVEMATTEQSINKLLYEADLQIMEAGSYTVRVTARGGEGMGSAQFDLVISPEKDNDGLGWLLGIPALIAAWFLWRRWRKASDSAATASR